MREPQLQQFLDAWRDYGRSIQGARQDAWLRSQEASRDHVTQLQQIQMDAQRGHQEAYREYLRSIQESPAGEDLRHRNREARDSLQDAARKVQQTGQRDWDEAQRSYRESGQQLQDELRRLIEDAWRGYVRALQKAWSELNVDQIEADELATIAKNLMAGVRLRATAPGC